MGGYQVPSEYLKHYSPKEIHDLKGAFKEFDVDGNGSVDVDELSKVLTSIGEVSTTVRVKSIIAEVDLNHNGTIEFSEFLTILSFLRNKAAAPPAPVSHSSLRKTRSSSGADSGVPQLAHVVSKQLHLHEVKSSSGGMHSYSEDEKAAFTEHINNCLNGDPDLTQLPLRPNSNDLFSSVMTGILLCKLINQAVPDTIDLRAVNKKANLNVYQKTENHNLCINAAKAIGCSVVNIGPQDLLEGKPILVLGLVWQIVKIQLTSTINLKHHPELVRLLLEGESLEEFMKLPPDQILLRWMNYHLTEASYEHRVMNFGRDVQDAKAYNALLHQIAPSVCSLSRHVVSLERASDVISNAQKLNVEVFLKPSDITSGNTKLNMSFVAQLFNTCPALDIQEEDLKQVTDILDEDIGDTREERVFRMWINSLALDGVYINNLFGDLTDGVVLLKLIDKIEPGIVAWTKVNLNPKNKFKKVENCNYCVILGKQMKFSLVNIGGVDITEGNKKLVLALIWQLMRYQQLKMLSLLGTNGRQITDKDIIEWANQKVKEAGKTRSMIQFRDLALADGLFLLDLVYAVEPRALDYSMVSAGRTRQEKESNAKYLLSVARKIGATVFLTFEDILEVKPKMIMTFVATLMFVAMNK